jgi:hypothetical protein
MKRMSTMVLVGIALGTGVILALELPEIRRYYKMLTM